MCGIVAAIGLRTPVDPGERALGALAHRGPDGNGAWASADRTVFLGHTRLAIRDLATGAQPLASEDGDVVAVVNGELYDEPALRAELEACGHRFRTKSDSELVVHAWETWGEAMLERLRGEFAFALWDGRAKRLFAARDRFGIKPLAWARHDGGLVLASQVRALFALGVPRRWDRAALALAASFQYAGPGATVFEGVHELAAGHLLSVDAHGEVRIRRWWDLDVPREKRASDPRAAALELRTRFDDAVRERLIADVPVAVQLSGGLDSTAVLAAAVAARPRGIEAFTVSFAHDARYDEHPIAARTAAHFGVPLRRVVVGDAELAESFADAVVAGEGPCINAHAAAKLRLSAAIRAAGFPVVLTGEGADELLLGYAHLRSDLEGSSARVTGTNAASMGLMLPDGDGLATTAIEEALGFVPTWIRAKASFGARVHALVRPDALGPDFAPDRALAALLDGSQLEGRERVDQSAITWTKLALEGYILRTLGDGQEMANGVEGRLPMLDHRVWELVRELPTELKIRGGVEKWVLREALRDRLPPEIHGREKHPFLAPPMGPKLRAVARDVFSSASFASQPLFEPRALVDLLDRWGARSAAEQKALDPVVHFALSIAVLHARLGLA